MSPELKKLIEAGLFALGFLAAKEGTDSLPVEWLARALKEAGAECSHLDAILAAVEKAKLKEDSV